MHSSDQLKYVTKGIISFLVISIYYCIELTNTFYVISNLQVTNLVVQA